MNMLIDYLILLLLLLFINFEFFLCKKVSCWEGKCMKKDELSSLILIKINASEGNKMVFSECRKTCNSYKTVKELENPGKTVTGCQYLMGGGCGYYTEPIQDLGVNATMDIILTRESATECMEHQCCVFRECRSTIILNNIWNIKKVISQRNFHDHQ